MEDDGICYSYLGVVTRIQGATMKKSLFLCEVLLSLSAPLWAWEEELVQGAAVPIEFLRGPLSCKPVQTHLAKLFLTFLHYR